MRFTDQVREFLAAPRFAVLATINADGTPQQSVVWYDIEGDEILINTAAERVKDRNARRDARVSLCVEDGYHYVTLLGTVRFVDDQPQAQADIARLARRYIPDEAQARANVAQYKEQQRVTLWLRAQRVVADLD